VADALLLFDNEIFTTFDLRPNLSKITAPTLVITGEDDFIRPARVRPLHLRRGTGPLPRRGDAAPL
jgi:pimeloyl-ACP methyl ester carboxylesterase